MQYKFRSLRRLFIAAAIVLTTLAASACGGGGGSGGVAPPQSPIVNDSNWNEFNWDDGTNWQ